MGVIKDINHSVDISGGFLEDIVVALIVYDKKLLVIV